MQIEIIEKDCRGDKYEEYYIRQKLELSYRVTLEKGYRNKLVLTREYYRVGFYDGETWDGIYKANHSTGISKVSIMTHNFDKIYLSQIEEKVIKTFIKESHKSIEKLNKELLETKKWTEDSIKTHYEILVFLPNYERMMKILKIKEKILTKQI